MRLIQTYLRVLCDNGRISSPIAHACGASWCDGFPEGLAACMAIAQP